jgi:hypothetical protein
MPDNRTAYRADGQSELVEAGLRRHLAIGWLARKGGPSLLLLVTLCFAGPLLADDPKPGASYREIPWGTPVIEAMRILEAKDQSMTCPPEPASLDTFDCGGAVLIGNTLARNTFVFEGGKLSGALITFESTDYAFLKLVFVEKFGTPAIAEKAVIQNLAGAVLSTDALMWPLPEAKVVLLERAGSMTKGVAVLGPKEWFERFTKTQKDQAKKAVGDF